MTMKLVQKCFLKGSREFEIVDDALFVRIKSLFKEEKLTIDLSMLDPEPVIKGSELEFFSQFKGRPVLSLLLNKPNTEEFNAFLDTLKQQIMGEGSSLTPVVAVSSETAQSALARNVYEEPPTFLGSDDKQENINFEPVNVERLDEDITMLKTYLDEGSYKPLLDSLETLKAEPQNEAAFLKMMDIFDNLGIYQGAVLTYAPYLKVLLSKYI